MTDYQYFHQIKKGNTVSYGEGNYRFFVAAEMDWI